MKDKQNFVRIFLVLFIASILLWLVVSTSGFMELREARASELPQWLKDVSPVQRGVFLTFTFQLTYWLIALGLFMESCLLYGQSLRR